MKQPNIIEHLQDVLFLYSTVILPDIGEFSKQETSANINEHDNVIVPQKKVLFFDSNMKHNDFILVKHLAKKEQISEAEAQHHVDVYVAQLQEELSVGHTINLEQIGELSKDAYGRLLFVPNEEANYSLDTFGLPPVVLPEIQADKGIEIPAAETVVGAGKGLHTTIEKKEIEMPQNDLKNSWIGAEEEAEDYMTEKVDSNDGTIAAILAAKAEKNAAKMPLQEPLLPENKKKKAAFWMWLLPIMILCLFFFLLLQLSSSDKEWWQHKPFSYFAKDKNEVVADNTNTDNGNDENANSNSNDENANENENSNAAGSNGENAAHNNANSNAGNATSNGQNADKSASTDANKNANNSTASNTGNNTTTNTNDSNSSSSSANSSTNSSENTPSTSSNTNTTTSGASSAELNKIKVNEPKANEYLATNSPKGYYVIIGAFKGDANANKKISELKNQGFTAYSLPTKSGWNRVGIYHTDIDKAKNQLLASKKKHNKGAWLLHFK